MLFSRVYNWIKYKTLPPSVLFLNRLFVERDSKHRRVTSNLGLTFRNSKWSTYARVNINLNSKTSYLQLLLRVIGGLLLVVAVCKFSTYYNATPVYAYGYPLLWFLFDADLYLKVLFSSSLFCTAQLIVSSLYSRVLKTFSTDSAISLSTENAANSAIVLPKRLHKPIVYSWLTTNPREGQITKLFETHMTDSQANHLLPLTQLLYKSTNFLSKSAESRLAADSVLAKLSTQTQVGVSRLTAIRSLGTDSADNTTSLALDYLLLNSPNSPTSTYFNECCHWTLSSFNTELQRNSSSVKSLNGLFYSSKLSHLKLNQLTTAVPELAGLRHSVEDQLSTIRWQRWLYKYNILHRSALKNTLYLTSTKKLLSTGFYSSTMSTNNIWASSTLNNESGGSAAIQNLTRAIYGDFSGVDMSRSTHLTSSSNFYSSASLSSLSFYELSYHWFIQRFYQFNTLAANGVSVTPALRTSTYGDLTSNFQNYERLSTEFDLASTKSFKLPASTLDLSLGVHNSRNQVSIMPQSDVYLQYADVSLFTKQRTEVMQNLTSNFSGRDLTFYVPGPIHSSK